MAAQRRRRRPDVDQRQHRVALRDRPDRQQVTPDTDELGPPPALVGPKAPVAKEAEEDTKEKADAKAAASTNSPDQ